LVPGGGARIAIWISPTFFVGFDALAHYAELSRPTGKIALTMPSVSAALALSLGKAWLQPRLSVGARVGYAWMSGVSASGATIGGREQGVWAGPELLVELSAWPRARVHPLLSLSLGASVLGVRGTVNGARDVDLTGVWSSLSVGVALR
jgi:hypothetical protein